MGSIIFQTLIATCYFMFHLAYVCINLLSLNSHYVLKHIFIYYLFLVQIPLNTAVCIYLKYKNNNFHLTFNTDTMIGQLMCAYT